MQCKHRLIQQRQWIMFTSESYTLVFTAFKVKVDTNFPTTQHNQTLESAFDSLCACSSVPTASHACTCALVAKRTQVFWCFTEHGGPLQPRLLQQLFRCDLSHMGKDSRETAFFAVSTDIYPLLVFGKV